MILESVFQSVTALHQSNLTLNRNTTQDRHNNIFQYILYLNRVSQLRWCQYRKSSFSLCLRYQQIHILVQLTLCCYIQNQRAARKMGKLAALLYMADKENFNILTSNGISPFFRSQISPLEVFIVLVFIIFFIRERTVTIVNTAALRNIFKFF